MTKSQLKKHRVANKKAVKKHRTHKTNTTSTPNKAFKTPQSLGKVKEKISTTVTKASKRTHIIND